MPGPWVVIGVFGLTVSGIIVIPHVKRWIYRKQRLKQIKKQLASLRKEKKEIKFHQNWAYSRGETQQAQNFNTDIEIVDGRIFQLLNEQKNISVHM